MLSEQIWVGVDEGAKRTGGHIDYIRRLARDNMRLPEDERFLHVRKEGRAYEIWLPDLVNYVEKRIPATMAQLDLSKVEKIWVNASEAVEITGYHRSHVSKLSAQMAQKPESEREIQIKKRSTGTELWLPDLIAYVSKVGRGPKKHHQQEFDKIANLSDNNN